MTLFDDGPPPIETAGAYITPGLVYRYHLWRRWAEGPVMAFVMLNPSTATGFTDDPTIRRCIGFAKREGMAGIDVVNLFAWRATKPADLVAAAKAGHDVVGPDNDRWTADTVSEVDRVVLAWGAMAAIPASMVPTLVGPRVARVLELVGPRAERLVDERARARGSSFAAHAPHPLMLRSDAPIVPYRP